LVAFRGLFLLPFVVVGTLCGWTRSARGFIFCCFNHLRMEFRADPDDLMVAMPVNVPQADALKLVETEVEGRRPLENLVIAQAVLGAGVAVRTLPIRA
jgi:hypothetical protein